MTDNLGLLEAAHIIYTTGFFIISNFEALKIAAKFANDNGKIFGINLSAVYVCHAYKKELLEAIEYADYVFGNEDETSAFAAAIDFEYTNLIEVTEYISRLPKINQDRPRIVTTT